MKNEQYFGIEFLLRGKTEWYPAVTLATDEQDAIRNFLIDYLPSMGTIVAVHVLGDDDVSRKAIEALNVPMVKFRRDPGQEPEPCQVEYVDTNECERYERELEGEEGGNSPGQ